MRFFYAKLLFFLCCTRGWWRTYKKISKLIDTGALISGDKLKVDVVLTIVFPEYDTEDFQFEVTHNDTTE